MSDTSVLSQPYCVYIYSQQVSISRHSIFPSYILHFKFEEILVLHYVTCNAINIPSRSLVTLLYHQKIGDLLILERKKLCIYKFYKVGRHIVKGDRNPSYLLH